MLIGEGTRRVGRVRKACTAGARLDRQLRRVTFQLNKLQFETFSHTAGTLLIIHTPRLVNGLRYGNSVEKRRSVSLLCDINL